MNDFLIFFAYFLESTSNKLLNEKKTKKNRSRYLSFISSYKLSNFKFLLSYSKLKIFLEIHEHEQIIVGGWGFFLQKNAFSNAFQDKNWNKGVLLQFKA